MTPSVRTSIRDCFPAHMEEAVLSILLRYDSGASARSAIVKDFMLRAAAGDMDKLAQLVDAVMTDPHEFHLYRLRWSEWMRMADQYDGPEAWTGFMAGILRKIAPAVCHYRFRHVLSHMTLCLYPIEQASPLPGCIYITPVMGDWVYIGADAAVLESGKTKDQLCGFDGELAEGGIAPGRILLRVSQEFATAKDGDVS